MSAALLRQALEFVDPDESSGNRNKKRGGRRTAAPGSSGQERSLTKHSSKVSKQKLKDKPPSEEVVKKLLKLSQPAVDTHTADKIIKRACSGKPVADEIKLNTKEEEKSILFPDEDFQQFEQEPFCS